MMYHILETYVQNFHQGMLWYYGILIRLCNFIDVQSPKKAL